MYAQVKKQKENKSRVVANDGAQKKSNVKQGFGFLDNRPEAVTQRKAKALINSKSVAPSVSQKKSNAVLELCFEDNRSENNQMSGYSPPNAMNEPDNNSSGVPPVQRVLSFDGVERSQNDQYGIPQADKAKLYVHPEAAAPQPIDYFQITGDAVVKVLYPPNQRENQNLEVENLEDLLEDVTYTVYSPTTTFGPLGNNSRTSPNDCGTYAGGLNRDTGGNLNTINETAGLNGRNANPQADFQPEGYQHSDQEKDIMPGVGGSYLITWAEEVRDRQDEQAHHHVATVIAADGIDRVTSEAHSEKQLEKPEFDMYGPVVKNFYDQHADYFKAEGREEAWMKILAP
jgi:hypothetical protein